MRLGLIPAHAGKIVPAGHAVQTTEAHPRSRGENVWMPVQTAWRPGSSPLTRGKCRRRRVQHPVAGSSPLTRGKWHHPGRPGGGERLIPAHAGKIASASPPAWTTRAHPRSRGENAPRREPPSTRVGSSPLTRGKSARLSLSGPRGGLIPAHAGKMGGQTCPPASPAAHPRSRGENTS